MLHDYLKLRSLGERLRDERLKRNQSQAMFAARIGVSIPTFRKMESGDPGVTIGHWLSALDILDQLDDIDGLLAAKEDLFAKYETMNISKRKRVSRKKHAL